MNKPILNIVIPCYNEEEVLPITSKLFLDKIYELIKIGYIDDKSRVLFVNDGSKDKTWDIIKQLSKEMNIIREFARAETGDIRMQYWPE